ncbi:putative peptidase M76, ATP23 [Helianthus anomalus]
MSGGYSRGEGIVVCSNHLTIQDEVTQVVIHELIHAYDDCRAANLDWTNCAHHACTLSRRRAGKWCSSREARDGKFIRIRSMVPRAPLMEVCAAFWDHTPSSPPSPVLHHARRKWLELWT